MRLLLVGLLVALVAAPAASAKGNVVARLESAFSDAPAGRPVSLKWKLDGEQRPFSALGVFARIRGGDGSVFDAPAKEQGYGSGRYVAMFRMPRGGIADLRIGVHGSTDVFFRIADDPFPATSARARAVRRGHEAEFAVGAFLVLVAAGAGMSRFRGRRAHEGRNPRAAGLAARGADRPSAP